ncbi:MAG: NADH:ubiquinone oxidoreductase subunit [Francisellaceae bacterium]|nr:NADH:ubiquinone oxidoreductase subunit [Francisellaceae bacterium]
MNLKLLKLGKLMQNIVNQIIDNFDNILFYGFAGLSITAAILVISTKNPIKSVLGLVFTFISTAILWLLIYAEFLSITLVLVYVGAVMVLFLFVVMMLDIEKVSLKSSFTPYLFEGIGIALFLMIVLVGLFNLGFVGHLYPDNLHTVGSIQKLGQLLFKEYLYPLEIAGALLLNAIVAAISLTFRGKQNRKVQDPSMQTAVNKASRLKIIANKELKP